MAESGCKGKEKQWNTTTMVSGTTWQSAMHGWVKVRTTQPLHVCAT
nr:MAG TPA: hypothetical protein [Microviridae sp.]